jgi:D-lactate dehydrogenase (cytochrome)
MIRSEPLPAVLPTSLLTDLQNRFGNCCSTSLSDRLEHGRDESPFEPAPPEAVVYAQSTDDVVFVLQHAHMHRTPVIPFGAGSSLEGHVLAVHGGISLDVNRMNEILEIRAEDRLVRVQPGVTRIQLNDALRHTGLFFPVDPGANASIGGMCATGASGTNAVRYGTMRQNVLGLQVVGAQGQIFKTGTQAPKSSAGYDLTRLMIGSEGTLGVITEITLKLHPQPEAVAAAVCVFPDIESAVNVVMHTIQTAVPIARCELVDVHAIRAVNRYDPLLKLVEAPTLMLEFHGTALSVNEQVQQVQSLCAQFNGSDFQWAEQPEDRKRLWQARHHVYLAALQLKPGSRSVTTDTCVPISALANCISQAVLEANASSLLYFLVGHVGDGNFHMGYLVDPQSLKEMETAERLSQSCVRRALSYNGTCTGEHGIGLHKIDFLVEEAGEAAVQVMRQIKDALDPHHILNPGKIFTLAA